MLTARGMVFLEGASALSADGAIVIPSGTEQVGGPGSHAAHAADAADVAAADNATEDDAGADTEDLTDAQKSELAQYWKWQRNGHTTGRRPFALKHLSLNDIVRQGINPDTVKAGGVVPKDSAGRAWPAWEKDQETADYWARRISQAFTGINFRRIAELWLQTHSKYIRPDVTKTPDAVTWLASLNLTVAADLGAVLQGVYADGYYIGMVSAQHAIDGIHGEVSQKVDWGTWQPGNDAAARAVAGDGLEQLLQRTDVVIKSVAANRMTELADRLAVGLDNGDSIETITSSLSDVLSDLTWARTVAMAETSRAITFASQQQYGANGIRFNTWMAAGSACEYCLRNEEAGPVAVGASFPSGSPGPPAHPNCRCAVAPYLDMNDLRFH